MRGTALSALLEQSVSEPVGQLSGALAVATYQLIFLGATCESKRAEVVRLQGPGGASHLLCETAAPLRGPDKSFLSDCTHSHNPPVAGALGWRPVVVVERARSPPVVSVGEVALRPL